MENKFGLSDELYNRFLALQERHVNAWESDERIKQHSLVNIEKVDYDHSKDLFYVYYKETNTFSSVWYHYDTNNNSWW